MGRKRIYPEHNKDYLNEEKKLSTLSKDWLRADSPLIQQQANDILKQIKKNKKNKWFKMVLVSTHPNTWIEIECSKEDEGAYFY